MKRFDDERYYRTSDPELATVATKGTLAQWRHQGIGPPYVRFGKRVLYQGGALNSWIDSKITQPASAA